MDLTKSPYKDATVLSMDFKFTSDNQTITQSLPPVSSNQIIMVDLTKEKGVIGGKLVLNCRGNDVINGSLASMEFIDLGYNGYLMPVQNENSWQFVSHHNTQNVAKMTFIDTMSGREFEADRAGSMDDSVIITDVGGTADFKAAKDIQHEGVMASVGMDETINSKYPSSRIFFEDVKVPGGAFVYQDMPTKSIVMQDIKLKPGGTPGTKFFVALAYEPSKYSKNKISQDGYVRVELVGDDDVVLVGVDGRPMGVEVKYKAGEYERKELYLGEYLATTAIKAHLRFETSFENEEIISVGAGTSICIQAINEKSSSGEAIRAFIDYTGYSIIFDNLFYGDNFMNLAKYLNFAENKKLIKAGTKWEIGRNAFLFVKDDVFAEIKENKLYITGSNNDMPVYCIYKLFTPFDIDNIIQNNSALNTIVKIQDKKNAFDVSLLSYSGDGYSEEVPLVDISNGVPVWAKGWKEIDTAFISEDPVNGIHEERKLFNVNNNDKQAAIMILPHSKQSPSELVLADFEIDIVQSFTRLVIREREHISEKYLKYQKGVYTGVCKCPSDYSGYRYTADDKPTKVPAGIILPSDGKVVNNNAWFDVGSLDPDKVQGDIQFDVDGMATMRIEGLVLNDKKTANNGEFWLAKVNGDGTLTEVTGSKYGLKIEPNTDNSHPQKFVTNEFSFRFKKGDSFRIMMKSNITDGFYIECTAANGLPMIKWYLTINSVEPSLYEASDEVSDMWP